MSTARIRELNDTFRLDPQRWGRLMITCGLQEMGAAFVEKAIIAARTFDRFTSDNDPVRKCQDLGSAFQVAAYLARISGRSCTGSIVMLSRTRSRPRVPASAGNAGDRHIV